MAKKRTTQPLPIFSKVQTEREQTHITRLRLFKKIEAILNTPLVTFFTSFAWPVSIEDSDADMIEGVLRSHDLTSGLTLLISSPGGDGEAAERIVNLCRNFSKKGSFKAIIPGKAKSAATMIAFGAEALIMGPSSELGPVDPQIITQEDGTRRQRSAYNIVKSYDDLFQGAVKTEGNIQPFLQQLEHYDARDIEFFREAIRLSDDISVKTLRTGMMSGLDEAEIRNKVEVFLKPDSTKSHGRPIFRAEAESCGLKILRTEDNFPHELGDLIYELYYRTDMFVSSRRASKCIESSKHSAIAPPPKEFDL